MSEVYQLGVPISNANVSYRCNPGEIVTEIHGRGARLIDSIGMTCSDGKVLQNSPSAGGGDYYSYNNPAGWKTIPGRSASLVDGILNSGGDGGDPHTLICGGQDGEYYVSGYNSTSGNVLNSLTLNCGRDKRTWCVGHLEDPICEGINASILNQACAKNFTATCIDRKEELKPSIMQTYCAANPTLPICSCYAPVPSYIDPSVAGLQHCWNATCAAYGYKPNNSACPPITVCRQDLTTSGANNLLQGVNISSTCGSGSAAGAAAAGAGGGTGAGAGTSSGSGTGTSSGGTPTTTTVPTSVTQISYTWLFIILLVLAAIYGLGFAGGDDNDNAVSVSST